MRHLPRLQRIEAMLPAPRPAQGVQPNPLDVLGAHLDRCLGDGFFASVLGLDVLPAAELAGLGGAALADLRHRRQDLPPPPGCPPGQSVATMLRVAFSDANLDALGLGFVKRVRLSTSTPDTHVHVPLPPRPAQN